MSTSHIYCPYCRFRFRSFAVNAKQFPAFAPIVCESCGEVGLMENGLPRKLAPGELDAIKQSPAWRDAIEPALEIINREKAKRS